MRVTVARQARTDGAPKGHVGRQLRPATPAPAPRGTPAALLNLQRTIGNRATGQLVQVFRDARADDAAAGGVSLLHEGELAARVDQPGRAGRPLDPAVRSLMESRFGEDFGAVRIHTDTGAARKAEQLGALAYTFGRDVHFAAGQYNPATEDGMRLLAHELTHVVQADVAVSNAAQPSSSVNELESEAGRAAGAFGSGGTVTPVHGVARGLAVPLRQEGGTFANLYGPWPASADRVELRQLGGLWYEVNPRLAQWPEARGGYFFAYQDGRIWASRTSDVEASQGGRVTFAGRVQFDTDTPGTLTRWNHDSPSYRPSARYLRLSPFYHLQLEFDATPRAPGREQLPVTELRGGGTGGGGGGTGGGGPSRAVTAATGEGTVPQRGSVTPSGGGLSRMETKPPVVSPHDLAAELAQNERQIRRMALATQAVRYGLGAWNAYNVLTDAARALSMAASTLARGSPYGREIQQARDVEQRAAEIERYYASLNMTRQMPPREGGDPEVNSTGNLQNLQFTYLSMERQLHDALESVKAARCHLDGHCDVQSLARVNEDVGGSGLETALFAAGGGQTGQVRDEMARRARAMVMPTSTTSLGYAEAYFFADAGRQMTRSLLAARDHYVSTQQWLEHHGRMARAAVKELELRLRALGSTGPFDMSDEEVRSASLDEFSLRRFTR